jgi:hypothetical protein
MAEKKFRTFLTVIALLNFSIGFSQNYSETAFMFSRQQPTGSARILGLGGAKTALGGDYTAGFGNPAGLGMFNRSEVTVSTALTNHTIDANYLGTPSSQNKTVFNIPGLSLAWHMPKDKGAFLGGTFSVSFARMNDFNQTLLFSGKNTNNSIIDYFIDQAYGATTSQFQKGGDNYNSPTGLAYYNYLIGAKSILKPPGPNNEYFTDAGYPEKQQEENQITGASNQWSFAYGANISDKFYFGGGVGFSSLRYKSQKVFTENFLSDTLQYLQLNETLAVRGSGVNLTLGTIIRPIDNFQIGLSYSTPTFYNMSETYEASMGTRWNHFDYYGDKSTYLDDNTGDPETTDIITSDYTLTLPGKVSAGATFLSKYGFITADVELTNPAKAKYNSTTSGVSFSQDNDQIKSVYKSVINYRIGAEGRYDKYRLRLGYGIQANAYNKNIAANNQITTLSAGVGMRSKTFYIDFAVINSQSKTYPYQPYTFFDGAGPKAYLKNKNTTGLVTLGFIF